MGSSCLARAGVRAGHDQSKGSTGCCEGGLSRHWTPLLLSDSPLRAVGTDERHVERACKTHWISSARHPSHLSSASQLSSARHQSQLLMQAGACAPRSHPCPQGGCRIGTMAKEFAPRNARWLEALADDVEDPTCVPIQEMPPAGQNYM